MLTQPPFPLPPASSSPQTKIEETCVSVAYPLPKTADDHEQPERQHVYAYLPVRSYGLKFVVNVSRTACTVLLSFCNAQGLKAGLFLFSALCFWLGIENCTGVCHCKQLHMLPACPVIDIIPTHLHTTQANWEVPPSREAVHAHSAFNLELASVIPGVCFDITEA